MTDELNARIHALETRAIELGYTLKVSEREWSIYEGGVKLIRVQDIGDIGGMDDDECDIIEGFLNDISNPQRENSNE